MKTLSKDTAGRMALRFAAEIREWYAGDDQFTEAERRRRWSDMLARNRAEFERTGHFGATNDDYDANEAIGVAWDETAGIEWDSGSQEHADVTNDAWAIAARNEFDEVRIKAELA
jgi:hypothetical protein